MVNEAKPTIDASSIDTSLRDELLAQTDAFIAEDGPWEKFTVAVAKLDQQVQTAMHTPEYNNAVLADKKARSEGRSFEWPENIKIYRTQAHRPAFNDEDVENILVGHYGLHGELGNGPGRAIYYGLQQDAFGGTREENIFRVVQSFDCQSEFAGGSIGRGSTVSVKLHGKEFQENSRQAFSRIADEIDLWLAHNHELISQDEQAAIKTSLGEYRAALAEVEKYVNHANNYFAKVGPPAPEKSNGVG